MTKVYVSASPGRRWDEVCEIQDKLQKMGHKIAYDWTKADVKKPYRNQINRVYNSQLQAEMLRAATNADIFILLDNEGLRGAYVELGAFLTKCLNNPEGKVAYIVGEHSHKREFIFESPDYVHFAKSIEEVYKDLK